jgi:hypothetical protein
MDMSEIRTDIGWGLRRNVRSEPSLQGLIIQVIGQWPFKTSIVGEPQIFGDDTF